MIGVFDEPPMGRIRRGNSNTPFETIGASPNIIGGQMGGNEFNGLSMGGGSRNNNHMNVSGQQHQYTR